MGVFKGPKVDVLDTDFAGGADPNGVNDSTAAIQAAISYAQSLATNVLPSPVVYLPRGTYKVSGSLKISGGYAPSLEGDGSSATFLNSSASSGDVIEYLNAGGFVYAHVHLSGFTLTGTGHNSTANLLELLGAQNMAVNDVHLQNTGGICINMQGGERNSFNDVELDNCRRPVNLGNNLNETYFHNYHIIEPGTDAWGWNWNVNAVPSTGLLQSASTWLPDYHAAITVLNSQNTHFNLGSIKSTRNMGCYQMMNDNGFEISGTYCEAFSGYGTNPSLQVGGASEMTRTTSALTASSLTATVDDALYNSLYIGDSAAVGSEPNASYVATIYPPDYIPGSLAISSICSGVPSCAIQQGTTETVIMQAFTGASVVKGVAGIAGTMSLNTRGAAPGPNQPNTVPQAWPAGAVVVLTMSGDAGDGTTYANHWNGLMGAPTGWTEGCSPTTLTANWIFSPSQTCGEYIVGPVYNGFDQLIPSKGTNTAAGALTITDDVTYMGGDANLGAATVVVSENANVVQISKACSPSHSQSTASQGSRTSYANGYCLVRATTYPDNSFANLVYRDVVGGGAIDNINTRTWSQWSTRYAGNAGGTNFYQYDSAFELTDAAQSFYEYLNNRGASFRLAANGYDSLQITGAGVTSLVPFAPSAGIVYPQDGYDNKTSVTVAAGTAYAQWDPAVTGTLTLPPVSSREYFTLLVPAGNTQSKKIVSVGGGSILIGTVSAGTTWTWPNGYPGAITFYADGVNWQVVNPLGTTKTCTALPTVVAGVVTGC